MPRITIAKSSFAVFEKEMDILYEELDAYGIDVKIYDGRSSRKNASRYFGKYAKSVNITNSDGL